MTRRGPPKTPTAIKKARGTHRADRDPGGTEPTPAKSPPRKTPAAVLADPVAYACWKSTSVTLRRMGLLSASDMLALELLCLAKSQADAADLALQENRSMFTRGAHGGLVAHPAIAIARNARLQVTRLLREFGLTPSARASVRASEPAKPNNGKNANDPKKNPEAFLFGNQRGSKVAGHIGA